MVTKLELFSTPGALVYDMCVCNTCDYHLFFLRQHSIDYYLILCTLNISNLNSRAEMQSNPFVMVLLVAKSQTSNMSNDKMIVLLLQLTNRLIEISFLQISFSCFILQWSKKKLNGKFSFRACMPPIQYFMYLNFVLTGGSVYGLVWVASQIPQGGY